MRNSEGSLRTLKREEIGKHLVRMLLLRADEEGEALIKALQGALLSSS